MTCHAVAKCRFLAAAQRTPLRPHLPRPRRYSAYHLRSLQRLSQYPLQHARMPQVASEQFKASRRLQTVGTQQRAPGEPRTFQEKCGGPTYMGPTDPAIWGLYRVSYTPIGSREFPYADSEKRQECRETTVPGCATPNRMLLGTPNSTPRCVDCNPVFSNHLRSLRSHR
jgi:hypothetical protein